MWQIASALVLAWLALARPVAAQQVPRGIALDRFETAPAGDCMLGIPDPTVASGVRPSIGVMGTYARDPLILVYDNSDRSEIGRVVTHQLNFHAMAAIDFAAIAKLHVDIPFMASQGGSSPSLDGVKTAAPDSAVLGDVRTGLRLALVGQHGWVPSVAANANVWIPTGDDKSFTSSGSTRYLLELIVGADKDSYLWRVTVGRHHAHDDTSLQGLVASDATLTAGAAYRFGSVWLGPELHGSTAKFFLASA